MQLLQMQGHWYSWRQQPRPGVQAEMPLRSMQTRQSTQRQTHGSSPVEEGREAGGAVVSQTEPPEKSSGPGP